MAETQENPRIIGVTRVRNEEPIIADTLDHVAELVDEIVAYDDCSTDATAEICETHSAVSKVIRGQTWDPEPRFRALAEGTLRQVPYEEAVCRGADWVYYFDGDEFLEPDFSYPATVGGEIPMTVTGEGPQLKSLIENHPEVNAFRFRLFDFYITPEDQDRPWMAREWLGPEYRDILMLFKVTPEVRFHNREPSGVLLEDAKLGGWVRHYGKAISIEHWEETCDYYVKNRGGNILPQFGVKWAGRRGKAIHSESDFGAKLIRWGERISKGIPLVDSPIDYMAGVTVVDLKEGHG